MQAGLTWLSLPGSPRAFGAAARSSASFGFSLQEVSLLGGKCGCACLPAVASLMSPAAAGGFPQRVGAMLRSGGGVLGGVTRAV